MGYKFCLENYKKQCYITSISEKDISEKDFKFNYKI